MPRKPLRMARPTSSAVADFFHAVPYMIRGIGAMPAVGQSVDAAMVQPARCGVDEGARCAAVCASAQTRCSVIAHDDQNRPGMEIRNELEEPDWHLSSSIAARAVLRGVCRCPAQPAPRVPARADRPAYRALDAG